MLIKNCVTVVFEWDCQVWDTLGCNIPQGVGNIKSVYSSNKVGVLIFCVSATEDNSSITQSILNFIAEFGEDVWRNAVVALTFASTVADYEQKSKIQQP